MQPTWNASSSIFNYDLGLHWTYSLSHTRMWFIIIINYFFNHESINSASVTLTAATTLRWYNLGRRICSTSVQSEGACRCITKVYSELQESSPSFILSGSIASGSWVAWVRPRKNSYPTCEAWLSPATTNTLARPAATLGVLPHRQREPLLLLCHVNLSHRCRKLSLCRIWGIQSSHSYSNRFSAETAVRGLGVLKFCPCSKSYSWKPRELF